MSAVTKTDCTCDICGASETIKGTGLPESWHQMSLFYYSNYDRRWVGCEETFQTCSTCYDVPADKRASFAKAEIQKSLFKKLFSKTFGVKP